MGVRSSGNFILTSTGLPGAMPTAATSAPGNAARAAVIMASGLRAGAPSGAGDICRLSGMGLARKTRFRKLLNAPSQVIATPVKAKKEDRGPRAEHVVKIKVDP